MGSILEMVSEMVIALRDHFRFNHTVLCFITELTGREKRKDRKKGNRLFSLDFSDDSFFR